jgi:hypothetical protein
LTLDVPDFKQINIAIIVPIEDSLSAALLAHSCRRRNKSGSLGTDHMDELEVGVDTSDMEVRHKAQQEYLATGKLSERTKDELKKQMSVAATKMTKAYGSAVFEEVGKLMDVAKGGKWGWLWNLAANSELASLDDKVAQKDKFKQGVAVTIVEMGMGSVVKLGQRFSTLGFLGPLSYELLVLDLADSFYDQKNIDKIRHRGLENLSEAQYQYHKGRFFSGWALERAAADQLGSTARAEAGHTMVQTYDKIATKLVLGLNSIFNTAKPDKTDDIGREENDQRAYNIYFLVGGGVPI